MVHTDMIKNEFAAVVDHVLDVVDPLHKEAEFLEKARAWRDLVTKAHGGRQSYDRYWSDISDQESTKLLDLNAIVKVNLGDAERHNSIVRVTCKT